MARKRRKPDPEWAAIRERSQRTLEQARALIAEGEARIAARRRTEARDKRRD
jgi:head-tail adaptor